MAEAQSLFFKEHFKFDLFEYEELAEQNSNEIMDPPLQIGEPYKLKLLCSSNLYGYLVAAFNDSIKIIKVSQFDTNSSKTDAKCNYVGHINLESSFETVIKVALDLEQTHLLTLTCVCNEDNEPMENYLHVYDLRTLNFNDDASSAVQTPDLINKINLTEQGLFICDMAISPSDNGVVALLKSDGKIDLWNVFEASSKKATANVRALCICWSPKGKNLAAFCDENKLVLMTSSDLEIKSTFKCPENDLMPTDMIWLAKKQFLVSFIKENNEPFYTYYDVFVDKNTQREMIQTKSYDDLSYLSDASDLMAASEFSLISEWGVLTGFYSKCSDFFCLQKQSNDSYEPVLIDDYRCTIPLNVQDQEAFPVGFALNLNAQAPIEFSTFGTFAPCPLLFILDNYGRLISYFMINMKTKANSICQPAKQIAHVKPKAAKHIPSSSTNSLPKSTPNSFATGSAFTFNVNQSPGSSQLNSKVSLPGSTSSIPQSQNGNNFKFGSTTTQLGNQPSNSGGGSLFNLASQPNNQQPPKMQFPTAAPFQPQPQASQPQTQPLLPQLPQQQQQQQQPPPPFGAPKPTVSFQQLPDRKSVV